MGQVICRKKSFDFSEKWTVVSGNFESYLSLLNSPEFMALSVSKDAYSAPALTAPEAATGGVL